MSEQMTAVGSPFLAQQSSDMELEIVAALTIAEEGLVEMVAASVEPHMFANDRLRLFYEAMLDLHAKGRPVSDLPLLTNRMRSKGTWVRAGGMEQFGAILDRQGHSRNTRHYIESLVANWCKRRAADKFLAGYQLALDPSSTHEDVEAFAAEAMAGISSPTVGSRTLFRQSELVDEALDWVFNPPPGAVNIKFEHEAIDAFMASPDSGLFVLGAETGGGKSIIAETTLATEAAMQGAKVLDISLELPRIKGTLRRLSAAATIEYRRLQAERKNRIDDPKYRGFSRAERAQIQDAATKLRFLENLVIDQTPNLNATQVVARMRKARAMLGGLDLVIIDHLGYMSHGGKYGQEHSDMSDSVQVITDAAKSMNLRAVLLSQLNTNRTRRSADSPPNIHDFYAASKIKHCAIVAAIVHRPDPDDHSRAEMHFVKNRDGFCGVLPFRTEFQYMRLGGRHA